MHSTMDLNNEKIQMRKDIKRAKVWVISKLVRQIKNLENKKGSEMKMEKNKRRSQRLVQELDAIKDMKPDEVFKQLVGSQQTESGVATQEITLEKRALMRIASVSFIKSKIGVIKMNVDTFHKLRTGKQMPSFDRPNYSAQNSSQKREESNEIDSKPNHSYNFRMPTAQVVAKTNSSSNTLADKSICTQDNVVSAESHASSNNSDADSGLSNESDIDDTKTVETIPRPQGPCVIITATEDEPPNKISLKDMATGHDDVTEVLKNIGDGFDSEESGDSSDIDLEDLAKTKTKTDALFKIQDNFFLNSTGTAHIKSACKDKTETERASDDEERIAKSCFVESLTSVSHQRNKGKNRLSQRARKRLATKSERDLKGGDRKSKQGQTRVGEKSAASELAKEAAPLHPSWEASKKRKQEQNSLQEFQGKRVCFDSD